MKFIRSSMFAAISALAIGLAAPALADGPKPIGGSSSYGNGYGSSNGGGYAIGGHKTSGISQSYTDAKLKLGGDCGCNELTVKAGNFTGMEASGGGFSKVGSNSGVQVGGYMKTSGPAKHGKK